MVAYDGAFFEEIEPSAHAAAMVVVPYLVARYRPRSVADVGCGQGCWTAVFEALGVPALGLDGAYVPERRRLARHFQECDLNEPLPDVGRFDLAVCLEVAEHLPESSADRFVADLCGLSDRLVFSAATPGQGGHGHLNEQPHRYWIDKLVGHGFDVDVTIRDRFAADRRVAWWYRRNMVVAERVA